MSVDWGWARDQNPTDLLRSAVEQLHAYFDGQLRTFDLPLLFHGTRYRQAVWRALIDIPFGCTTTYGTLAAQAGGSARSVGQAVGDNPLPILVPCHRVLGTAGLGGFSGGDGPATKRLLLMLEGSFPATPTSETASRRSETQR